MNHDDGNDALWSAINRIEISVKNSQDHIKRLFLHSTRHEVAIEALDAKVETLDNIGVSRCYAATQYSLIDAYSAGLMRSRQFA